MSVEPIPKATPVVGAPATPPSPEPAFDFAVARNMGVVVVTARGPLKASSSAVLKAILVDLIEGQGNLRITVDILDMAVVDPSSMCVLVEAATLAARRGGQLTLAHPPKAPLVGEAIGRARTGYVASGRRLRSLPPPPPDPTDSDPRRTAMARHPSWAAASPAHLRSVTTTTSGADQ